MLTSAEYEVAQARAWELVKCKPAIGSAEGRELERLAQQITEFDDAHYPVQSDPIGMVEFMLEQRGLKCDYLTEVFKDKACAESFFAGEHKLTDDEIKKISVALRIPVECLS